MVVGKRIELDMSEINQFQSINSNKSFQKNSQGMFFSPT
jgi:hypothetical protein